MPNMKVSHAEKQFLLDNRYIIGLTERDWNKEPYVTKYQLLEMPTWKAQWFQNQTNVWRWDIHADVLRNCAHPDNEKWWLIELAREALDKAKSGYEAEEPR